MIEIMDRLKTEIEKNERYSRELRRQGLLTRSVCRKNDADRLQEIFDLVYQFYWGWAGFDKDC